ncbi:MAG TPA: phosphoadenosine phosphosulfate reductase family protein [Rhodanobacteraceae bacterium]|nr:phosphoadenosine phosphosulfate reductase family protein [Rhodanobacteraceae bacterium]
MNHIGAISGGKDSVAMAVLLHEQYPDIEFTWVCTPTGNEPPEWFAHMRALRDRIGPIIPIMSPGGLSGLINHYQALPNWRQRWCTRQLKIEPFAKFLAANAPAKFYVGLRADEEAREGGDYANVSNVEMIFPLREAGMGLAEVVEFNRSRGIEIPKRTDCMLCFFQRLIEWYELWRDNKMAYVEGENYEMMTGHTFRSPGRDSWPASLRELRAEFESGRVPKDTRLTKDPMAALQCRVCRL